MDKTFGQSRPANLTKRPYIWDAMYITYVVGDGPDEDYRIDYVGGVDWEWSIDKTIRAHLTGTQFYVMHQGYWARVIVAKNFLTGRVFLRTVADGQILNNLSHLALHERNCRFPPLKGAINALSELSGPPRKAQPSVNALSSLFL